MTRRTGNDPLKSSHAPAVPLEEIERRTIEFQQALRNAGLDGALIVQTTDLYYLTGTAQNAHLVVPAESEPVLYVRKSLDRARAESPVRRIEPFRSLRALPQALRAAGLERGRIGLELDVLPAARYLDYRRRLDAYDLTDCSAALLRVRARKSRWELERIRQAGRLLTEVAGRIPELLRAGMTEIELAAEVERVLRRSGHQGVIRMRAFNGEIHYGCIVGGPSATISGAADTAVVGPGPNAAVGMGSSSRPIRRGEPLVADLVGSCDGYLADQTRTFSLGPVSQRVKEAHRLARLILRRVASEARIGVPGSHLYDLAQDLAASHEGFMGVGDGRVAFVGHGFGLELDEPPFLASGADEPLAEGMVFALEPKFVLPGEGAVGIENSYIVTSEGAECLTLADEELVEVGS